MTERPGNGGVTVRRPRPGDDAPSTVELPVSMVADPDLRLVASTGCALQVVGVFAVLLTVAWTLTTVVFAGQLATDAPILGRAIITGQAMLSLGALVGGAMIVRYLGAVRDARKQRPIAVSRALAAHRDVVATAVVTPVLSVLALIGGFVWGLFAG